MSAKPKCKSHSKEATHLWECKSILICESCLDTHTGFDHTKIGINELNSMYATRINRQLIELDERLGRYSTTTAGKINFITTEYINGMHAMVDDFKNSIQKRYQMISDTFAPFTKIDEKALQMKEVADELSESNAAPADIVEKMALWENNLNDIKAAFEIIGEINEKTSHLQGEIDTDLRDEIAEFRDYIEDLFLTFKFPMDYNDTEFYKRQGGLKKTKV